MKSYQRVLCLPLSSSVHRNLRTLYIHHTFTSLRPILLPGRTAGKPGESGEAAGVPKPQGTARLSVPLAEMIIHAVEGVKSLCEDVTVVGGGGAEAGKGVESREEESLTMQNLDVCRTYSSWQCVQLVLDYLPLLHHLFSLIVATFKKIQNHVSAVCVCACVRVRACVRACVCMCVFMYVYMSSLGQNFKISPFFPSPNHHTKS